AEGRVTEYSYGDSNVPRQPTLIRLLQGTSLLRRQEYVYDSKGRTLSEKLISPVDELTVLQEIVRSYGTSANENGLLKTLTQKNVEEPGVGESTSSYDYDAQGRVIKTSQTSLMGTCQFSYTVYDA